MFAFVFDVLFLLASWFCFSFSAFCVLRLILNFHLFPLYVVFKFSISLFPYVFCLIFAIRVSLTGVGVGVFAFLISLFPWCAIPNTSCCISFSLDLYFFYYTFFYFYFTTFDIMYTLFKFLNPT